MFLGVERHDQSGLTNRGKYGTTMKTDSLIHFSLKRPKILTAILVVLALALGSLMVKVQVDTDPENMLAEDEAVRVFHHQVKKEFSLYDMVVLGVVNEDHPDGVFNPSTLERVHELTVFVKTLENSDDPQKRVVSQDLIAPGTVDTILQDGPGQVRFEWLMKEPPKTREQALLLRDRAMSNPLLKGTLVSEDGRALAIYIPITAKDFAAEVRTRLLEKIATFDSDGGDKFYITGVPVAEDTFGMEMFKQMALSAPLAMAAIFLLMLMFFRNFRLIIAPMVVAILSVICTMGLLIGTGHTLHIMSSMIPIFLMPIAVVDSIHILSEFFDNYQKIGDRKKTIKKVVGHLFMPMLYTSLTSAAGFASLALTPIPPVQSFGIFVAIGILLAWIFTILFVPAYIMMLKEEQLADFGISHETVTGKQNCFICKGLRWLGGFSFRQYKLILSLTFAAICLAAYGISLIQVNDNPINWFQEKHPIRVADKVLNQHFGGTYEAFLVLEGTEENLDSAGLAGLLTLEIEAVGQRISQGENLAKQAITLMQIEADRTTTPEDFLEQTRQSWEDQLDGAGDDAYEFWDDILAGVDRVKNRSQIFKRPDVLRYIENLQAQLLNTGEVGKSNSITDVVKKVHQELFGSDVDRFRVPDTEAAVAQVLISFQNSHKPDDLFHLVTPDYRKANIWVQLKNGDNQVMEKVVREMEDYFADNPPPVAISHNWAGLTYINVVWQAKMVEGMREAFLSSFLVVLVMMVVLFRSFAWGLLAMVPLSVTIAFIYGIIGLIGKDYDMPVAVLSSLTLGLAVDFAIHFLERVRGAYAELGNWQKVNEVMFEEPARAITRNVVVIAVGFTPLLLAPLVPYQTVGVFLASIMAISGVATMLILPAAITWLQAFLFKGQRG